MSDSNIHNGGCHCAAVRYRISGPIRDVVNCHCEECQHLNGNFGAHSKARTDQIEMIEQKGLSWYAIGDSARRGFCKLCGTSLFWEAKGQDSTGIIAGSLDERDTLNTIGHIFVSEKAGFYEITDDLPQFEKSSDGKLPGDFV